MRHRLYGRKLGRNVTHRAATRRALVASLLRHERIITTWAKAKDFAPFAEKLITLAKEKNLHNVRRAVSLLQDKEIVRKLFDDIGPRFRERAGGYTRVVRLGGSRYDKDQDSRWAATRLGDNGPRVLFELVEKGPAYEAAQKEKAERATKGAKGEKGDKGRPDKAKAAPAPPVKKGAAGEDDE